jgi:hypothetical protein
MNRRTGEIERLGSALSIVARSLKLMATLSSFIPSSRSTGPQVSQFFRRLHGSTDRSFHPRHQRRRFAPALRRALEVR